jgi:hypothetical protein
MSASQIPSPHATSFGSKMESDRYLELVEEGMVDEVEGGCLTVIEPEAWFADPGMAISGVRSVRLSKLELEVLEAQELVEEWLVLVLAIKLAMAG